MSNVQCISLWYAFWSMASSLEIWIALGHNAFKRLQMEVLGKNKQKWMYTKVDSNRFLIQNSYGNKYKLCCLCNYGCSNKGEGFQVCVGFLSFLSFISTLLIPFRILISSHFFSEFWGFFL